MRKFYVKTIISMVILALSSFDFFALTPPPELTEAQAIARVRAILRGGAGGCRITKTQSVSAVRVKAGWRVTARVRMSASGTPTNETAVWIVSAKNGAAAQNQLTAEIARGCP